MKSFNTVFVAKNLFKNIIFWPTSPYFTKLIGKFFFSHTNTCRRHIDIDSFQLRRLLVIRLDNIGDVVMTSPFLRELRRNLPNAWISLVVSPTAVNLVEKCPYVNEVLCCGWRGSRDIHRFQRHWKSWRFAARILRPRRFDLAVLPRRGTDFSHGAFLAYFSGARYRLGYSDENPDEKEPYFRKNDCLFTHVANKNTTIHEVESGLELLRHMKGNVQTDRLELWIGKKDRLYAESLLESRGIKKDDLLIAFSPSKWDPKRRWPISRFADVALWFNKEYGAKIIVLGGTEDDYLGRQIETALNRDALNVAGRTTLRQSCAFLEHCALFVGNDSGPKHLAAAAGIPIVEINCHALDAFRFHADSPEFFRPWGVPYRILRPKTAVMPCSKSCIAKEPHCILGVSVDDVKKAAAELLAGRSCRGHDNPKPGH